MLTCTFQFGWTALYHAVVNGHSAIVDMLMAAGADMNIGSKVSLITCVVITFMGVAVSRHTLDQRQVLGWPVSMRHVVFSKHGNTVYFRE